MFLLRLPTTPWKVEACGPCRQGRLEFKMEKSCRHCHDHSSNELRSAVNFRSKNNPAIFCQSLQYCRESILSCLKCICTHNIFYRSPNHWRGDCVSTWPATSSASAPCMESLPHKGPTGSGLAPSSWPVSLGEGCPFDPGSLAIFERKIFQICVHAIYIYTCITY